MLNTIHISNISSEQINPRVLTAIHFDGMHREKASKLKNRFVYDYELEFFLESDGAIELNGTLYPIQKNDVVFRRPGDNIQSIMPYSCYFLILDLLNNCDRTTSEYIVGEHQASFQSYYTNSLLDSLPTIYRSDSPEKYRYLFERVCNEFLTQNESSDLLMKSLVLQILYHLHQDIHLQQRKQDVPSSAHYTVIKKTIAHIKNNLDADWKLDELARFAGMSTSYFHSIFTKTMQSTPNDYIVELRIENAKKLLIGTESSVLDIAMQCGFGSGAYFGFVFKRKTGVSPSKYRKAHSYP